MRYFFLVALLFTAACASRDDIGSNGYSVSYAEGYSDGCASSQRDGIINDDKRFDSSGQYAMGWSDGFRTCETPEEANERLGRTSVLMKGVNEAHNNYFQSYSLGQQPTTKVSGSIF